MSRDTCDCGQPILSELKDWRRSRCVKCYHRLQNRIGGHSKLIPAIIVDLDGTLADCRHRRRFLDQDPKDWKGFFEAMVDDTPNGFIEEIMRWASQGNGQWNCKIIFVSGRPGDYLEVTKKWLAKWDIEYDAIYLREKGDYRPDEVVKLEIYKKKIAPHFDVRMVFDDRDKVVKMWRSQGVPCLQVAEGDF